MPSLPPRRIASLSIEALAESVRAGYRTQYLHGLARRIAGGQLEVESWTDPRISSDGLYEQLRSLKGFGSYAASVVMKLLGRHDRLSLDTSARAMFKREFSPNGDFTDRDIEAHYEEFGN